MTTITARVRTVPRMVLGTTLQAARLPLTAVERFAGQAGNDEWPPALAFEGAEATVEALIGSLLRDEELVRRGRLRQARVHKLRQAGALEAQAELTREQADTRLQHKQQAAEQHRAQVETAAEQREQRVEQQADKRKQEVEKAAAARKQAVRQQTAEAEKVVARQERASRLAAVQAETEAVAKERAAVAAEERAVAVDETLERTREARKAQ